MHRTQEGIDNMKKMKIFGLALGVLALIAVAQPANAACGAPFLITSINGVATCGSMKSTRWNSWKLLPASRFHPTGMF